MSRPGWGYRQIWRRFSRSNRLMDSGSEVLTVNVSVPWRRVWKVTEESPREGSSHHGERGRLLSRTNDRIDWSR